MSKSSAGRVIVGVDASAAGLGALRAAVEQARCTGRDLIAVRAYTLPVRPDPMWQGRPMPWAAELPDPGPSQLWQEVQAARAQQETRSILDAFGQAMGGVPPDIQVTLVTSVGAPSDALVSAAYRDDDLLVVGKPSAGRLRRLVPWRWFRRATWRRCAAHATCPVLAVPVCGLSSADPDPDARWPSPVSQERSGSMSSVLAEEHDPGDTTDATGWPERACCCAAPPMAKAVLPVGEHHTVDLFLCGHHYRSSLGPLALTDATVTFREGPSVPSLAVDH
ncbi:universal stress protein [Streptomyces pluripotens]|uniref:Universal stress protein n=1 Tax=Streptomyces pluripotens TaxID=1355015 RepID=A0A221NSE0_9ACTN|nr:MULTISPECIES: universal stress protein [Streptomyces]ASN22832.1 universal stress protein [Streptomyces pluripotens]MCH0558228.1 universal stress protein [Streptomyces sp. MUM 16J]